MLPSKCRTPMQQKPKANWGKASDEQRVNYIATLENNLRMKSIPTSMQHCKDVHCCNANHHYESDNFMIEIVQTIKSTAEKCLLPNDEIQPLKAMF